VFFTVPVKWQPQPEESESAVYAVVRSGSKQQKVAVGDVIEIDKMDLKANVVGSTLTLPVVMVVDGETVTATGLDKAAVTVEILGATKGPKIVIQKYKNKTGYKKRQGHRQKYTQVKVTDISL
jgi:large subunit ribosomal protein L21